MPHPCSVRTAQSSKVIKFAVVDEEGLAYSSVWSVTPHSNRNRTDVFVASSGLKGATKFSFHQNVLHHSWLSEKHKELVEEGIAPAGERHWAKIPISSLPWHGMTVRFVDNLLRKTGKAFDGIKGTIVALPKPNPGVVLDVGFILATGPGIEIKGAQFAIGEVGGGGRSLVVVGRYSPQSTNEQKEELRRLVALQPVPNRVVERLSAVDDLAMMMFGEENGAIIVTEVHNVRYTPKDWP